MDNPENMQIRSTGRFSMSKGAIGYYPFHYRHLKQLFIINVSHSLSALIKSSHQAFAINGLKALSKQRRPLKRDVCNGMP